VVVGGVVVVVVVVVVDVVVVDVVDVVLLLDVVGASVDVEAAAVFVVVEEAPVAGSSDAHAAAVIVMTRVSARIDGERVTTSDGIRRHRRSDWHTGVVGVAGVRHLIGTGATFALVLAAASCGADGPTTELERGEAIYAANCAQCHGADLGGSDRGPSLLEPVYGPDQLTDAEFADAIRNGVESRLWDFGDMPGNGSYSDTQVDAIVAFVRSQQAGGARS
jgi:mono/diheme cytochrome c family protein